MTHSMSGGQTLRYVMDLDASKRGVDLPFNDLGGSQGVGRTSIGAGKARCIWLSFTASSLLLRSPPLTAFVERFQTLPRDLGVMEGWMVSPTLGGFVGRKNRSLTMQ